MHEKIDGELTIMPNVSIITNNLPQSPRRENNVEGESIMKDREFYAKLVFGARWKKVDKLMASGELEEKTTLMEAFGAAGKGNDECYNHLVEAVQKATEQPVLLAGIQALGHTGRSAAASQLNYIIEHNTDDAVVAAAREAIRALRQ